MEIKSRQNPKVKHMRKLAGSRKYREQCSELLCDGEKLLGEALRQGAEIRCVMYAGYDTPDLPHGTDLFLVSMDIIEYISSMDNPQRLVFSCEMPKNWVQRDGRGVIVLENLQNPGNLGAIIRSADAFNMQKVILLEGCTDLYSPKTLRAAMGAVFRQPVQPMSYDELESWLCETKMPLLGAALSDNADELSEADISNAAVAIGSEGGGLSERLLDMCSKTIMIPMNPDCESLNAAVAASIFMWEIYGIDR